jgi:hypothetical protein
MLRRMTLVRTDVSEDRIASIIRVTRIGKLGTSLAVTSSRNTLRSTSCSVNNKTQRSINDKRWFIVSAPICKWLLETVDKNGNSLIGSYRIHSTILCYTSVIIEAVNRIARLCSIVPFQISHLISDGGILKAALHATGQCTGYVLSRNCSVD